MATMRDRRLRRPMIVPQQPSPAPTPIPSEPDAPAQTDAPAQADAPPEDIVSIQPAGFIARYFWVIVKNIVGWLFILSALPVGLTLPGPGGLPLFLLGFAMVTFPGKRNLTARLLSGR